MAQGRLSPSAARPGIMRMTISMAAIASSTTRRSQLRHSATRALHGWPSLMSISITATARRIFSTETAYPHFLGYRDERGIGKGEGFNINYPMKPGTDFAAWSRALNSACAAIKAFGPEALVVSLGVDTFEKDPISYFKLTSPDFKTYGRRIAKLKLPTLFVMEGGYAIEAIGTNTVNALEGFLDA
jgi:acetoin utilization deacetylase AcuC-like enzyme